MSLGSADPSAPGTAPLLQRVPLAAFPAAACTADLGGRIASFNDAAAALWGRAPGLHDRFEDWLGTFDIRSPLDDAPVPASDYPATMALRTRLPQQSEVVLVRADGTRVSVEMQSNPVVDDTGNVIGVLDIHTDVTARREAQIVRAHLSSIITSSDDAIISKTLEGRIVSWNDSAQRLFGYTSAEAVGQPVTMIIPHERHGEERDILAKLVRGERVDHYETVRVTKNGELLNVSLTSSPIRDPAGRIVGASKIARDITARKRNEVQLRQLHDELRQADQAKNDFLATLAHELRNPLAPLRSTIDLLRRNPGPTDDLPGALEMMDRQLTQMTRLVDDLMDVARISKNKFELRLELVDLAAVIATAVDGSRPLFAAREQILSVELPDTAVALHADGVRLTQAIGNILNNAAKYTPHGGRIVLRASRDGNHAKIAIDDTGIGIPPGMRERVFDLFVQADHGDAIRPAGLGVGLHLARRLAEMHGGTLTAASAGTSTGSTFTFVLPLASEASAVPERDGERAPSGEKRVIVVDDNRDAADALSMYLRALGHTATAFYDGVSALREGEALRPDVILLDIGLPGIDGYETARRIRSETWGKNVRLCALTGWGQDDARRQSRDAGFDAHFVKPLDGAALVAALEAPDRLTE